MLNRTIYYDEWPWLRNQQRTLNDEEIALRKEFGLSHVYPQDLFYRTHKITQKDLLTTLRQLAGDQAALERRVSALFDDDCVSGRRGVLTLAQVQKRQQKRVKDREKMQRFVRKFANEGMSNQEIKETGFMRHNMLY